MADTLPSTPQPVSPQPATPAQSVVPEQPWVTPPSAAATPGPSPQALPSEPKVSDTLGSVDYAGFGARFLASLVDGIIVGAIYFVLMIPVLIMGVITAAGGGSELPTAMLGLQLLFQGIGWILTVAYYVYFTAKGQTLGKKALKIRVVRAESGEAPGYTKAFLREVVGKMVSAMVFGLGYLWMLWDGKKQTWHDKIAGTVVIKS